MPMSWVIYAYLIYLFILSTWNAFAAGARLTSSQRWDKIAGIAAIIIAVIGYSYGLSIIFNISPLLMAYLIGIPLVGVCVIITVDTWMLYRETKSKLTLVVAIYNTFVTLWNIVQVIRLFKDLKPQRIADLARAGAAGGAVGIASAYLMIAGIMVLSTLLSLIIAFASYRIFSESANFRKVPEWAAKA